MAEKTPVSVLQELCIQEGKTVPMYDLVQEESDGKKFTYIAHAFDMYAKGSGRSKREAKHEASAKLICKSPAMMSTVTTVTKYIFLHTFRRLAQGTR